MNRKRLSENVGRLLKLRPMVRRYDDDRNRLPDLDDEWQVNRVDADSVALFNPRTRHSFDLGFDNIKNFQSPNYLILRCQISLVKEGVHIEPLMETKYRKPSADAVLAQALRDAVGAIPGLRPTDLERLLDDDERRTAWFAQKERTDHGAVILPNPWSPNALGRYQIPLKSLTAAREQLERELRAETSDPLDEE